VTRPWLVATTSAATTAATLGALRLRPPGEAWLRHNFRNRAVHLGAGPAAALGAIAGVAAAGWAPRALTAITVGGGLGLYDDLAGATHARGLRGHAAAFARGEVTTGLVKLVGLLAAGLVAAPPRPGRGQRESRIADAALIAGTANLVNLLDLRPGRALKVVALAAAPLAAAGERTATALLGSTAALLPGDLGERHMLGDCGANALGAALGLAMVERLGPVARIGALSTIVALTVASERTSFSAVIERQPVLAALDNIGRRP